MALHVICISVEEIRLTFYNTIGQTIKLHEILIIMIVIIPAESFSAIGAAVSEPALLLTSPAYVSARPLSPGAYDPSHSKHRCFPSYCKKSIKLFIR